MVWFSSGSLGHVPGVSLFQEWCFFGAGRFILDITGQQVSLEEYNFVYHLASVFAVSFPWQLGLARLGQSTEWVSQWSVMSSLVMWLLAWCLCSLELPRLCRDDSERVVALEQECSLWILIPPRWQTPRSKQNIMKHISPTLILHPLCFQVLWELNPTFFSFLFF